MRPHRNARAVPRDAKDEAMSTVVFPDAVLPGDVGAQLTTEALLERAPQPDSVPHAVRRLQLSRMQLRDAMRPASRHDAGRVASRRGRAADGSAGPGWADALADVPVIGLVAGALRDWWLRHPLRTATLVAREASHSLAQPMARQHPLVLALGAFAAGALLAWARPWRWILRPALFAGVASQIASRAVSALPIESWFDALGRAVEDGHAAPSRMPRSGFERD
jgi:hypothetical protein